MKVEKFKVLLYLKKNGPDKSGKAPLMGRITVNRSMVQFSCKLSCTPSLWNPRESRLNGKSREAVETNGKIEKLLVGVHSAFNSLAGRGQPFDATAVKELFQGSMKTQMTLLALLDRHIDQMKARVGIDLAPSSMSSYVQTRRSLSDFIQKKFGTQDVAFGQLNEQFIREYQDYCRVERGVALDGTVCHYLIVLKKVCRIAYEEGHTDKHYFSHFKLPKPKETTPKTLSRENFIKLRDLVIPEESLSHTITRDLFLFACYTGTAYVDAVGIREENLSADEGGNLWLKYRRKKTKQTARIKLLPEAIALIEKYRDKNRETLFPVQHYSILRGNMKVLGIMASLTQDITYHMGRHSFASLITLEEGVPIETVSRMLGHKDIKTTQIYARVTPKKLFEEMDRFIEATEDLKLIL